MKFRSELQDCRQFSQLKHRLLTPLRSNMTVCIPGPGQAKVTDLQITGGIQKQIAWLQISM